MARFTKERLLGEGGSGIVYLVTHNPDGRRFALKVIEHATASATKRVLREGRAQKELVHPNIVRLHGTTRFGNDPALLMEYVPGPALDEWLDEQEPTLDQALEWFRGIVAGVSVAHHHGLVHRDLKPANVLLKKTVNGWIPKVADFGLVKMLDRDPSQTIVTLPGVMIGTPGYMAPEQGSGDGDIDHRADMFALGCILYRLVCGQSAFEGDCHYELIARAIRGSYTPPEELCPEIPENVRRAIVGLLQGDRDFRVQNCDELYAILDTEPAALIEEPPVSTWAQWLQPLLVTAAGAVFGVLGAL